MTGHVLGSRVARVKIWTGAGRIVYSDQHALMGETFPLGSDEREALDAGLTRSEVSDLSRPENRFERSFGSLVEVYLPVAAANGTRLLFETYQFDTALKADQQRVWNGIFPALVAGLALLFVAQVPLSWRLARRLQRSSQDRALLLQRAIDSSETERWRIAGDLHDGPVQNLTAVSLTLGSAALRLANPEREQPSHDELVSVMQTASEESRTAIRELRTMIMEIAPPDLDRGGLGPAVERLAQVAREQGLLVEVDIDASAGPFHGRQRADLPDRSGEHSQRAQARQRLQGPGPAAVGGGRRRAAGSPSRSSTTARASALMISSGASRTAMSASLCSRSGSPMPGRPLRSARRRAWGPRSVCSSRAPEQRAHPGVWQSLFRFDV